MGEVKIAKRENLNLNEMDIFELIAKNNLKEIERWVLEKNTNKNVDDGYGRTPLHVVLWQRGSGNEKAAVIFINNELYVNVLTLHLKNSALHFSVNTNNFIMTKLLLEKGAAVNCINRDGKNPLECTPIWEIDHYNVLKIMLDSGASLLLNDGYFVVASSRMQEKSKELLVRHLKLQKFVIIARAKNFSHFAISSRCMSKFLQIFSF